MKYSLQYFLNEYVGYLFSLFSMTIHCHSQDSLKFLSFCQEENSLLYFYIST